MGSCFAEVMGERLAAHKFTTRINPFGVIFNPVSLAALLDQALAGGSADREGLVQTREGWRHYDFHSRLGAPDPGALLGANGCRPGRYGPFPGRRRLAAAHAGNGFRVPPQGQRRGGRQLPQGVQYLVCQGATALETIVAALDGVLSRLAGRHPHLRMLLTVSPVRHTKDTLPLNAVSKSLLRVACHALAEKHPHVQYFPAYEIMLDDLRDYRFYKPDMIHPSEVAETYIWQRLAEAYFDEQTQAVHREWAKLRRPSGTAPSTRTPRPTGTSSAAPWPSSKRGGTWFPSKRKLRRYRPTWQTVRARAFLETFSMSVSGRIARKSNRHSP
jgi:hypothetical protein